MAGHSKWSQIKHKKAKVDAQRGKLFTKLIRELTAAARIGGGNPDFNPRLRAAIEKAKSYNMPQENIERAIKKGTGELPGVNYEEVEYEGYGPGGVAIIVKTLTDNKNRTTGELRHIFSKHGGNLGTSGCVEWQFKTVGMILLKKKEGMTEDDVMMIALEAGVEDIKETEEGFEIITAPEDFYNAKKFFEEKGFEIEHAEITKNPSNTVKLDEKDAIKVIKLIEALEENDDVQAVYSNFDIPDEVMEKLSA